MVHLLLFITDADSKEPYLKQLLTFVSGQPTLDAVDEIVVKFMQEPTKRLLEANSFNTVFLPLVHQTYKDFRKCWITSLFYGGVCYGRF